MNSSGIIRHILVPGSILLQLISSFSRICIETSAVAWAAIVKFVGLVRVDPCCACLTATEYYIKFVVFTFPFPFGYYYNNADYVGPKEGIPLLRPTHGFRKRFTAFVNIIVMSRVGWFALVVLDKVKVISNGMFTSDFCFVATLHLTTAAVLVIWFRTWQYTPDFCWLHNTFCEINRDFSGKQIHSKK